MTLNRNQFRTFEGVRFKTWRHPDLQNAPVDHPHFKMAYVTEDNYGIERVMSGPRIVYGPSGDEIDEVESNVHAARAIKEHREKTKGQ